jgi:hypothetical protein
MLTNPGAISTRPTTVALYSAAMLPSVEPAAPGDGARSPTRGYVLDGRLPRRSAGRFTERHERQIGRAHALALDEGTSNPPACRTRSNRSGRRVGPVGDA